jgi:hypothetical protein
MERTAYYALGAATLGAAGLLAVAACTTSFVLDLVVGKGRVRGFTEFLDENTTSVPVVGRNIVVGSSRASPR